MSVCLRRCVFLCPCCMFGQFQGYVVHSRWEVSRLCPWWGGSVWRISWGNMMVRSVIAGGLVGLSLEKDALSFLHPRVVLHQLRVQKRILRDDVFYPLYQAVCEERKVKEGALFGPPLWRDFQSGKPGQKALDLCDSVIINLVLYDFCLPYLQYDVIISTGRAAIRLTLDGFVGCSSVLWSHFGHIKAWLFNT